MWLIYWTLLLWAWIATPKVDSIEVTPRSLFVAPRGQTTLTCSASAGNIEWLRGQLGNLTVIGNNINDTREVLSPDGSELNITDVSEKDQCGDYYCLDAVLKTLSCPATVSLAGIASHFELEPSDTVAQGGEDSVLLCRPPVSQPPAVVGWTKDGHALSPDGSHVIGPCGLVILNASVEDAGTYQCVAFNPVTMEQMFSREAHFNVTDSAQGSRGSPSIMVAPPTSSVMEGSSITLQCVVPGCVVSWEGPQGTLPSAPGGVLTLENISPSDGGHYNCTSVCGAFVLSAMVTVFVQVLPRVKIQPSPIGVLVMMPEGNTLACTVNGTGFIRLYWLASGMLLASEERTVESSLTLHWPVRASGFYQCMAVTSQGCDHSEVYVLTTPIITPATLATPIATPPRVSITPSGSVSIMLGDSVELVCSGMGAHLPTLSWINATHMGLLPLPVAGSGAEGSMAWARVVVNSSGTYGCFAIDGALSSPVISVTVTVQVPSITATAHSLNVKEGGVVNISCTISGCGAQRTVGWTKGLLPLPSTTQGDITTLSVGPISLMDTGNYTCSVQCPNGFKTTDQVVVKVTTPQPPLHPPGHVNAIWTNGLIQVTWEAPPHPAYLTPILGYKLNWGEGDGPLPQSGLSSKPASVRSVSIATSNLLSSYTVAVWAYSRAGDGPMGVATLQPQITSPYVITSCDSTSSEAANVQWKAFAAVDKNTRLVYECSSAQVMQIVGVAEEGVAHLAQLLPNCSYTVWLQVNGKDVSNCSFTTPPGPLNISVTTLNGAVQLHWTLPQGAKVELYIGDHWIDVTLGGVVTSLGNLHSMVVMVTLGSWTATSLISVPTDAPGDPTSTGPTPVMTPSSGTDKDISEQVGILYGVIFGGLLVACVVALLLILALKYVQMTRMKQDKEMGIKAQRKQQTEAFRRMSLSRSSSTSLGKTPPPPYTSVVQGKASGTHTVTCIGYMGEARGSVTMDTSSRHSTMTTDSLKLTPPPGNCSAPWLSTPPPGLDHSSSTSEDAGSVGVVTYTIVTTRKLRKDVTVTDI